MAAVIVHRSDTSDLLAEWAERLRGPLRVMDVKVADST